jgi:putative ABC transport system permease protein
VPTQIVLPGGGGIRAIELHPWSAAQLTPFTLRAGSAPVTGAEIVLGADLAADIGAHPGQQVRLQLAAGPRTFTVSGLAVPTSAMATPSGATDDGTLTSTVFVDDAEAASLSPRSAEVIGVLPDRGVTTAALADAVGHVLPRVPESSSGAFAHVYTGAARGSVESPAVDSGRVFVIALSSVFGGVALLIAILVIAGTVGLSVTQRHRDIALLRAIGATPRQVRRMVVREALAVGVLASAAGVWPGRLGLTWLRDQFVSRGLVPASFEAHVSWLPEVVAAASALVIAIVAAWVASLRASRIRPHEALAETAVERRRIGIVRTALGLVALGGGITLCIVSASVSADSAAGVSVGTVFTLVVAVALLSPLLIRVAAATAGRLLGLAGVTGRVAAANTGTSANRLSAVVSSVVLAVALGGSLWFVQTSEIHVAAQQIGAGLRAGYVITPAAPGLQPSVTAAIRRTSGVTAATGVIQSTMFSPDDGIDDYPVQGVDPVGLARTVDLGVTAGSMAALHGRAIAIDSMDASALHLGVGQRFHGWFGDGAPASLRVVAVYSRGLGFAEMTVPRALLAPHTTSGLNDAIYVATAPGRPGVAGALRSELGRLAPGSSLQPRDSYRVGLDQDLVQNAWTNRVITVVLLVYVVIAAVNALMMYAVGRRRELAILRLSGMTRTQVMRMAWLEQVLLLGLALVIGAAIAAATLIPMVKGITGSATPDVPPLGWISVLGGVVLLGVTATLLPTRRMLDTRPIEAIGLRE